MATSKQRGTLQHIGSGALSLALLTTTALQWAWRSAEAIARPSNKSGMAMQSPALLAFILLQLGLDAPHPFCLGIHDTGECYRHILLLLHWLLCVTAPQLAVAPASDRWLCFLESAGESTDILLGAALSPASVSLKITRPVSSFQLCLVRL